MASLKSVKIGAMTYDVTFVDNLVSLRDDGTYSDLHGTVGFTTCTIKIEADQNEQVQKITLLHEAVHAILHNAGHDEHDEKLVVALGFGLYALLKDNPAMVTWLGLVEEKEDAKSGDRHKPARATAGRRSATPTR